MEKMNKNTEIAYRQKPVGELMTKNVPVILETATVSDVEKLLIKGAKNYETINYIYAIDELGRLAGELSIKELFRSDKQAVVRDVISKKIVSVHFHTDQERAALLALKHNLKALPVVDKNNLFLGVVTSDTILKILDNEAVEDVLKFSGILPRHSLDNISHLPLSTSLRHRLPWLILGLLGGILTAGIVGFFENTLSENIILASFIPLVVYMASAVGMQMEVFIIRDLAINPALSFIKYLAKQVLVVFVIGLIASPILYVVSLMTHSNPMISAVLGIALFFAILSSLVTGLVVPYLFAKLKFDPANASGPIATIIQDALSIIVYFTVASFIL